MAGTPTTTQVSAVQSAAKKYNVPSTILEGVWGLETTFGENVKTSSTGAEGDFQFEPSTAATFGYPLTNTPTAAQFQQQADDAAAYLAQLYNQHGHSWDAALRAYSGGGYGLTQVQNEGKNAFDLMFKNAETPNPSNIPVVGPAINAAGSAASAAASTASGIASIAGLITSGSFWLRVGEAIAGILLLAMGLRSLTGTTTTPITVAQGAAKTAATAAVL